jgi:hypothetical protein
MPAIAAATADGQHLFAATFPQVMFGFMFVGSVGGIGKLI